MQTTKVGLINVGVNASHGTLRSPIFDGDRFEFVPIPLSRLLQKYSVFPQYGELRSPNGRNLTEFIPQRCLTQRTDNDPNLITPPFTYGDWPTKTSRAANLKRLCIGDQLFFLTRLVRWRNENFTHDAGFYIIGFLEIERIFNEKELIDMAKSRRFDEQFEMIRENGHMLMMKDFTDLWLRHWKKSWVFLGSKKSERFPFAVPFDQSLAEETMLDSYGSKLTWPDDQTILQRIGSYTRSCKIIENPSNIDRLWEAIRSYNKANK